MIKIIAKLELLPTPNYGNYNFTVKDVATDNKSIQFTSPELANMQDYDIARCLALQVITPADSSFTNTELNTLEIKKGETGTTVIGGSHLFPILVYRKQGTLFKTE